MMSKKYQLKNGLKVILIESHKSPVVSVQMWVKTGSADEEKKVAGISHFIEHLVFKGTNKYKVGEIASLVEASGGELNAYTSFDQTVFYVTISKEFKDTALDVISEMMGFPTFDSKEIDNEREVVIEEIKRGQDNPGRAASQLLFSTMFKKHAYGRPVIGYDKIIQKVSAKSIRKYFESRYVPSNMTLVVAGDFAKKEMMTDIQQLFGKFIPHKLKKVKRAKEPKQTSPRINVKKTDFKQNTLYVSWRIPSIKHKDTVALEVLSSILGQSETSRLVQRLRIDEPITNSVGSFAYPMQDDGLFAISMSLEPKNLSQALQILAEEISRIQKEGPSAEELQRAMTNIGSQEFYGIETVDNLARKAGSYEFYLGDHLYFNKYIKQIYALKPQDIQKVAVKYLTSQALSCSMITTESESTVKTGLKAFIKELSKKQKIQASKGAVRKFKAVPLKIKESKGTLIPVLEEMTFPNGLALLMRKQTDSPSVVAKLAMLGGLRTEPAGALGTVEMFSRLWGTGTSQRSENEINLFLDERAAGVGAFSGRNSVGLSMECLSPFEKDVSGLFSELVTAPVFSSELLERERQILLNQIKKRNDSPAQICILNFQEEVFRDHPYSRDMLGTEASANALKATHLQSYYKTVANAKNTSLCVVGDFDKGLWRDIAAGLDEKLGRGHRLNAKIAPPTNLKNSSRFIHLEKEQSHIVVGYPGLTLFSEERFALEIIQSILSGQGGRLFLELRDKNSLAYSVSPIQLNGYECGYFGGYIGCSPEKSAKAIEMLRTEFRRLADEKVSPEELARAQRYLVGRHDIELQRKSAICNSYLFDQIYGMDPQRSLHVADDYYAVSLNDVRSLAEKIFKGPEITCVVGPKNPL